MSRKMSETVVHQPNPNPTPSAAAPAEPNVTVAPTRVSQSYQAAQVNATLVGWQQSLDLLPILSDAEQRLLEGRLRAITPPVIEAIATVATNHGGVILGVPFDADAAREVLAYVAASQGIASTAEQFARRVRDDGLQRYAVVADRAMSAYALMKRARRTPEGRQLAGELREVSLVVKRERPARAPKKAVKAQPSATDATAPATASATAAPSPTEPVTHHATSGEVSSAVSAPTTAK